jgi:hypothetical protein
LAVPWFLLYGQILSGVSTGARIRHGQMNSNVRQVQGSSGTVPRLMPYQECDAAIHIAGVIGGSAAMIFLPRTGPLQWPRRNGVKALRAYFLAGGAEPGFPYMGRARAGEAAVEKFKTRMSVIVLRPPAVYGPVRGTLPLRFLTQSFAVIPHQHPRFFAHLCG